MKRILLLLLIGFTGNLIFAQDVIIKRNSDEIKSKILEITNETIKYKDFEFLDGPIRNIKISEVIMIIYENGKKETFTTLENQNPKPVTKTEVPVIKEVPRNTYKGNYFMIGTGFGNSYGNIGLRIQGRFGGKVGFGIHAGAGYLPVADEILFAAGLKFFPYKSLYINTQFGFTGWEEDPFDSYFTESHLLLGPSFLVGVDQVWGKRVGFGFNAALGVSYNINAYDVPVALAMDLGFLIRF
jgi:hypothetical protein